MPKIAIIHFGYIYMYIKSSLKIYNMSRKKKKDRAGYVYMYIYIYESYLAGAAHVICSSALQRPINESESDKQPPSR